MLAILGPIWHTHRQIPAGDRIAALQDLDPAEGILGLRICDPAMGSGHFLVGLVDYLADRVIAAMADAEAAVEGYSSPLTERIDDVRRTILDNAEARAGASTRGGSTTGTSSGESCSSAAFTASTATRWRSNSPRCRSGCTLSPSARRSAFWITICVAATACSDAGLVWRRRGTEGHA